ncbi:endolytic transglycosylase MltG [Bacteroides caecimuris]|jgi:UPF0755 protein|uniref:endolytic transglycosylase MltG n=1 Tax=Bacteroides caecimuris TaxID=1796613 RepID=UPI0026EB583D|nr:endolytic transglycosylase MltG [Bacteroides caecimuris]
MKLIKSKLYLYIAGGCLLLIIFLFYYYFFSAFSIKSDISYVYIDNDDTADSVYTKLGAIGSNHTIAGFKTLARHTGYEENIRTGRYVINPGEGVMKVFRRIKNGQQTSVSLTIPEARTMEKLAGALSKRLMIDSTTIIKTLTDSTTCAAYGYDTASIVAMFVPNTYDIYWNTSIDKFMERMEKEHAKFWNKERTEKAKAMNMTPVQVATLASIIDEETANTAEKPMVAGMYYNRLKTDMPLQADPTIKFALKNFGLRRIYNKLLRVDSPYNTYKNTGLPPGPIKVASIAGIDAVLNHAEHDYIYMCAKEDFSGTHNFAITYEEHLRNAAKYSKALNERGIK